MEYIFKPIGVIHSCFKQKFGIPRQAGLAAHARAVLELHAPYNSKDCVRGLENFSHLWLIYVFHEAKGGGIRRTVRPPRLGGNRRVGVFATRAPFRPNPIGLSAVVLREIELGPSGPRLHLDGIDLLDGTPVLDIKPYLPYADVVPDAAGGFADSPPSAAMEVEFSAEAAEACRRGENDGYRDLQALVIELLRRDPRPAYHERGSNDRIYGMKLYDFDVKWRIEDGGRVARVLAVTFAD